MTEPSKSPTAWGEVIFGLAKDLPQTERMAVAIYAIYLCDSHIQKLLTVTPNQELSAEVLETIEIIKRKTPITRLEVAAELLHELTLPDEDEISESQPSDMELELYNNYRKIFHPDLFNNEASDKATK